MKLGYSSVNDCSDLLETYHSSVHNGRIVPFVFLENKAGLLKKGHGFQPLMGFEKYQT